MSMERCVLAKTCLMDRRCVDYYQCTVERDTEAAIRTDERAKAVEQFRAALLTGLDGLQRHGQFQLIDPEDVVELVTRVAQEVGR